MSDTNERLEEWKNERQREYERASEEGGQVNIEEEFSELLDIALRQREEIAALRSDLLLWKAKERLEGDGLIAAAARADRAEAEAKRLAAVATAADALSGMWGSGDFKQLYLDLCAAVRAWKAAALKEKP